jgi:tRNA/tmRNA/rRNA uracil-C5-methylase (TrmA/RlmC/RlmD family)
MFSYLITILMLSLCSSLAFSPTKFTQLRGNAMAYLPSGCRSLKSVTAMPRPRKKPTRNKQRGFQPWPFEYHEMLYKVKIHDLTNLGVGVARVDISDRLDSEHAPLGVSAQNSSWVVMVPRALPGEEVVVRVFRNFKGYSDADLIEVVEESPDRVTPKCEFFESCGGCQYQMMDIKAQRDWKTKQVASLLERLAGVASPRVSPAIGTDEEYFYRGKITPHYNAPKSAEDLRIGFQQRGTRVIEDIPTCVIATPAINQKYAEVREAVQNEVNLKLPKKGATLLFREGLKDGDVHVETNFRETIEERVLGTTFRYRAGEFFQNNAFALPVLVEHVMGLIKGDNCENLIDAYCGSGLFSLVGASHFKATYGVEISELAIRAAQSNAELNGITNAHFFSGAAEQIFEQVQHLDRAKTCILLDPPRKGCDALFLSQLFAFAPKKVVYISCDPATQARDTKEILAAGYEIRSVQPFDLFPQTRHIENVIYFMKKET